jgi:UDP-N-acetylglucosamine transferase subunit ALG13
MKIFCMVGMHDIGFDRLLSELDAIAGRRPEWEIRLQKGYSRIEPAHASAFDFKPSLLGDIGWADLVVSHGSVCILDALKAGKRLIVVPRLARYGEAMNDHQVEWSTHFARRFGFPIVQDVAGLEPELDRGLSRPPAAAADFHSTGLYDALGSFIRDVAGAKVPRSR